MSQDPLQGKLHAEGLWGSLVFNGLEAEQSLGTSQQASILRENLP